MHMHMRATYIHVWVVVVVSVLAAAIPIARVCSCCSLAGLWRGVWAEGPTGAQGDKGGGVTERWSTTAPLTPLLSYVDRSPHSAESDPGARGTGCTAR